MADYRLTRLIWYHTQLVLSLLDSIYRAVVSPFGLAVIEWHVVHELYAQDGQRPTDLAQQVGRASSSFTPILDGLEHKKWITRQRDPADRRVVRIHLTPHAYDQQVKIEASVRAIEVRLRTQLSDDDLEQVQAIQQKLEKMLIA